MINKKNTVVLFTFAFSMLMCSCTAQESKGVVNKKNYAAEENKNYAAKENTDLNIIYDYEQAVSLCEDACQEFARAVRDGDKADFTPYISNEKLLQYMQYRVENYIFSYNQDTEYKVMITEVKFCNDYVFVSAIQGITEGTDAFSLQGTNKFLIKNKNGRLIIADWYWDAMDSPDVEFRGEFSEENNLTFWDDATKYKTVLERCKHS